LTSPKDHSRIFSGEANEILTALKLDGSFGFVKKLYNSSNAYLLFGFYWRLITADFQSAIDNIQFLNLTILKKLNLQPETLQLFHEYLK
jgi:hypothetical protein